MNHIQSQTLAAEPMVGARHAASLLNLPPYFFTKPRCRASKRIPHYRVGQMVRFRMSELVNWATHSGTRPRPSEPEATSVDSGTAGDPCEDTA